MSIKQKTKSLTARGERLSDSWYQLEVLNEAQIEGHTFTKFTDQIRSSGVDSLKNSELEIFQLNIGKLCNQTCSHCHVDAGPDRKEENMSFDNLKNCLDIIGSVDTIHTVDITGGAPELHPHFRWFVKECRKLGKKVMNRCNLTVIVSNKKYHDLPQFFKEHEVQVISSLPYFSKSRTDGQRGDGVFDDSIRALHMLNDVGYGRQDSGLILDLVYNPSGAFLPASQEVLEAEFKRQLKRKFDIEFNALYCITNLPISRFLDYLIQSGNYVSYMNKLIEAYNPGNLDGLMCRNTISVSWDGYLYDCDFNQMLDLKLNGTQSDHISNFDLNSLSNRTIIVNQHCYGCTAGAGSSCGGTLE